MVFGRSKNEERPTREAPPANTPSTELPTFQWGAGRRSRCHLPFPDYSYTGLNSDIDEEAVAPINSGAAAAACRKAASFNPLVPREIAEDGVGDRRKRKRAKTAEFKFSLLKREIDEDFLAITGAKAPRKPQRRPKALQNTIDV